MKRFIDDIVIEVVEAKLVSKLEDKVLGPPVKQSVSYTITQKSQRDIDLSTEIEPLVINTSSLNIFINFEMERYIILINKYMAFEHTLFFLL